MEKTTIVMVRSMKISVKKASVVPLDAEIAAVSGATVANPIVPVWSVLHRQGLLLLNFAMDETTTVMVKSTKPSLNSVAPAPLVREPAAMLASMSVAQTSERFVVLFPQVSQAPKSVMVWTTIVTAA
jgi:hypothetical protein